MVSTLREFSWKNADGELSFSKMKVKPLLELKVLHLLHLHLQLNKQRQLQKVQKRP